DPVKGEISGEPIIVCEQVLRDDGVWRAGFSSSSNGLLVYEPGTRRKGSDLNWFDRSGTIKRAASLDERLENGFDLSPSDAKVAFVGDPVNAVWILDLERGTRSRITFDASSHFSAVWSPDEKRVAYIRRGAVDAIVTRAINGSGEENVLLDGKTPDTLARILGDWSRDGKYLVYSQG